MWVHFGYGRIGRAAITQFLIETGQDYFIVDKKITISKADNIFLKSNDDTKKVENIKLSRFDDLVFEGLSVISTSVTINAIPSLIPQIKKMLDSSKNIVYLVPFENDYEANIILKNELSNYSKRIVILESMIDMIVSNIVPGGVQSEMEPIIKIDSRINEANIVPLKQKWISEDVEKEHIIKFYMVNGIHATIAYFGLANDIKTIDKVVKNKDWLSFQKSVVDDFTKYLATKLDINESYLTEYANRSLKRFSSDLGDTVERVGRDPERKLSKNERLDPIKGSEIWKIIVKGANKLK